jgi:hypothetical protein
VPTGSESAVHRNWGRHSSSKKRDAQIGDVRSMISVPLMQEGEPIAAMALARNRVEPFIDSETSESR